MNTSSLSLFETFHSCEFLPQKESSALLNHQRLSCALLSSRQRCTYGGLVHTSRFCSFSSSGTSIHRKPSFQLLGTMSLLHSALVQVLRGGSSRGHKKPRRPSRHIGTALGNELRSSSALPTLLDVAPFPSHRRSRLLMRHSRNALVTIRHQRRRDNRRIPC